MIGEDTHAYQLEFAPDLLARIASRVAEGIAAMRARFLQAPALRDFESGGVVLRDGETGSLMVDVEVSGMTLRIEADDTHFDSAPLDDGAELAGLIVARVAEYARKRRAHANGIADLRAKVGDKLARDGLGMRLLDVMSVAVPAEESIAGWSLLMSACIEMLDVTLNPFRRWVDAWNAREAAGRINGFAATQRRRMRTRARLHAIGAVLEIDAVAERAIATTGKSLGDIVPELISFYRRDEADSPLQLGRGDAGQFVSVVIEEGCVSAHIEVPGKVISQGELLQLYDAVPETAALAAVGRPATDVVDLPQLRGLATITNGTVGEGSDRTHFRMKIPRLPILFSEMGG